MKKKKLSASIALLRGSRVRKQAVPLRYSSFQLTGRRKSFQMDSKTKQLTVGVLAFQGDVREHIEATEKAGKKLNIRLSVIPVRTKEVLRTLDGLIIPGGESTTIQKLCEREGMWDAMKKVKGIFGTCAGAILLADEVDNKASGQKTLGRIDMKIDRNAYGRQTESFEQNIETTLGSVNAVFIRAPKIKTVGKRVSVLAEQRGDVLACEQLSPRHYSLATCFHPEYSSTVFHERFLKNIQVYC